MTKKDEALSLLVRTRELIRASDTPLLTIYKESGISFYWLKKFRDNEIKDPSVNRVQKLYEYLTGKELEV